jgi:hypothetical protein
MTQLHAAVSARREAFKVQIKLCIQDILANFLKITGVHPYPQRAAGQLVDGASPAGSTWTGPRHGGRLQRVLRHGPCHKGDAAI